MDTINVEESTTTATVALDAVKEEAAPLAVTTITTLAISSTTTTTTTTMIPHAERTLTPQSSLSVSGGNATSLSRLAQLRSRASQVMQAMVLEANQRPSTAPDSSASTNGGGGGGGGGHGGRKRSVPSRMSLVESSNTLLLRTQRSTGGSSTGSQSVPLAASSGAHGDDRLPAMREESGASQVSINTPMSPLTIGATAAGSPTSSTNSDNGDRPRTSRKNKGGTKDGAAAGDESVSVGIKVTEGHSGYMLMYDMLTGMRNAVSRCVAKPYRPLEKADFTARHKLTFDILGNELTPSSRYEFKFKDYAPWVFRYIREHFKIEAADYLVSLTAKYVLSELGSPGKSGSFFYFSQDYRFIIKTIHHTEHKFLCSILEHYYEHIQNNPNSLLSRYYGLHRVKLPRGRKIHFVVMGNVFPPHRDIHETFDLKGSLIGRYLSQESMAKNPRSVQKDLNWLKGEKKLLLGPIKSKLFIDQMDKDVDFLVKHNIMDYSLLLGIHYIKRGNSERIRDTSLSVFEPDALSLSRQPVSHRKSANASNIRRLLALSDPVRLGPSSNKLPEVTPAERMGCVFYDDDGGFLATDQDNNGQLELYYLGIIDILTPYNISKMAEHAFKSITDDKMMISAVDPAWYGKRFMNFMRRHLVANDELDEMEKKIMARYHHLPATVAVVPVTPTATPESSLTPSSPPPVVQ